MNSQFKGEYNDKIVDETSVSDKLRKCSVIGQELVKLGRDWLMFVISTIAFFEYLPPGGSSDRVKQPWRFCTESSVLVKRMCDFRCGSGFACMYVCVCT